MKQIFKIIDTRTADRVYELTVTETSDGALIVDQVAVESDTGYRSHESWTANDWAEVIEEAQTYINP